jgi:Lar family restriction alleviation protein
MNTKNTASQPNVASIGDDAVMACPFCGGEGKIFGGHNGGVATINCESCDAYGPPARGKDAAISAWNRRVPAKNPASVAWERPKLALWNESCGSGPNAHWYGDELHEAGKAWRELLTKGERTMLTKYPGGVVATAEEMEAKFGDPKGSFTPDNGYMFDRWQEITVEVYGAPQQSLAPAADLRDTLAELANVQRKLIEANAVIANYQVAAEGQVSAAEPTDGMIAAAIAEFNKVSSWPEYDWKDAIELALAAALKIRASEGLAQTSAGDDRAKELAEALMIEYSPLSITWDALIWAVKCLIKTLSDREGQAQTSGAVDLIEAGALRQFKHNDGSEGFVTAYDKAIVDREVARLGSVEGRIADLRIAITPEHEGGFHAHIYRDQDAPVAMGYGQTVRDAIDAAQLADSTGWVK